MNTQYVDLNGEYFLVTNNEYASVNIYHPVGTHILQINRNHMLVNAYLEVSINNREYNSFLGQNYETELVEDCVSLIKENVTMPLRVTPTTTIFGNYITSFDIDLTPVIKYYPDLAKFVNDKHK